MSTQTTHEKAQRKPRPGSVEEWGQERYEAGKAEAKAQVAELTAQRDALLTACGKLADQADFIDLHILQNDLRGYRLLREVQEARQAIAQATGNGQ